MHFVPSKKAPIKRMELNLFDQSIWVEIRFNMSINCRKNFFFNITLTSLKLYQNEFCEPLLT